ncbi:MAG: hypothetical protein K2G41_10160 [Duncaniella sp.]|uniref:DUF6850 family outer membrane beta-barrel protein n=1 Tax=Duncaniella sp. TaxID=2518496 RepID=UPI0023BC73E3|nr:DUF6850 family outer membrane beta-barrel protein [Duncaniella sp.]MDE6091054.1 hypothetical protein [Duncaniella sp.]
MRKLSVILPFVTFLSPVSAFAGGEGDNSNSLPEQIQYKDYNFIHNVEDGSLNPVSIIDIPVSQLAILNAGYRWQQGDYHNIDASGHSDGFGVDVYGIKRLERISFEGSVEYFNETDRQKCWNSTLYQSKLNPFVLADSEPSDYDTERFRVSGRVAYRLSSKFVVGVNTVYNVGVMSDEKDPRLETKGMRFVLNPGVSWEMIKGYTLGLTGGLNLFSESSKYTCVATAVNYPFYLMSGLGTYFPQSNSSYTRDAKGTSWFAGGDMRMKFSDSMEDYLQVTYSHEFESAKDGGSTYQFKGGDYINNVMRVSNRFSITGEGMAHNVSLRAETNDVKGKWFDQKSVTVNGSTHYEVMSSSIKHKQTLTSFGGDYRLDLLDKAGVPTLTVGIGAGYLSSDTKNYPELYFSKYSLLDVTAGVMKHFRVRNVRLGVGVNGGYVGKLSSSYDFTGLELEKEYTMPMFAYLSSSAYSVNGRVQASIPVGSFIVGAYVDGGTTHCLDAEEVYKGKNMNRVNCGVSLTF